MNRHNFFLKPCGDNHFDELAVTFIENVDKKKPISNHQYSNLYKVISKIEDDNQRFCCFFAIDYCLFDY